MIIFRKDYLSGPSIYTYNGILHPQYDIVDEFERSPYSQVYDSGSTTILYVTSRGNS